MEIKFLYRKRISYFMELLYITLSRCHAPKSEGHAFENHRDRFVDPKE